MSSVKKRSGNAAAENAALNYIRDITGREGHIFRRVLEEDVGIDAHIELCPERDEPSGIVIALQVKSGESYIQSEGKRSFTFHATEADLQYWRSYVLPVYLFVCRPAKKIAYWLDVREACEGGRFEDMLAGVTPRTLVFRKSNVFSRNFFPHVLRRADNETHSRYNEFLASAFSPDIDLSVPALPVHIYHLISNLDAEIADKLLDYVVSRREQCAAQMAAKRADAPKVVADYLDQLTHALRTRVFESEGTGFIMMAFDDAGVRDAAAREIEAIVPTNRYLVLKGVRLFADESMMNHMLLVAMDEWPLNEERFSSAWAPVKSRLGLTLGGSYDLDFYDPHAAATFFTPNCCFQYAFETFLDSGHDLSLFDWCRLSARSPKSKDGSDAHLWISVGPDRVKAYYEWEPAIYWYFHCVRAIRTGGPWLAVYSYLLDIEFGVTTEKARDAFVRKVKAAKCLAGLPFMTKRMKEDIDRGMKWGEKQFWQKQEAN